MKQRVRQIGLCLLAAALLWLLPGTVQAASEYKELFTDYRKTEDSAGSMRFRRNSKTYQISYWNAAGQAWVSLDTRGSVFCNGTDAYYVGAGSGTNEVCLYHLSSQTGEKEALKTLKLKSYPTHETDSYNVDAVYGSQVFVTRSSFYEWRYQTYQYRTDAKTWKKVLNKGYIYSRKGKYVLVDRDFRSDVSPSCHLLYKITSDGLKKVKKLAEYCHTAAFAGNKLFYSSYAKRSSMKKVTIYRCKYTGSGRKKIGTISASGKYSMVIPYEFTSTYCKVSMNGKNYRYTYKTKKLKKIS